MFIWPDGSVTGSVRVAELEAFRVALAAGEPLDEWAQFFPPHLTAADYSRPEKPEPEKRGPGRPRKATEPAKEE